MTLRVTLKPRLGSVGLQADDIAPDHAPARENVGVDADAPKVEPAPTRAPPLSRIFFGSL